MPYHAETALILYNIIFRFASIFIRKDFLTRHYKWHDGIGFLLPIWMCFASGSSLFHAVIMWMWIICTTSLIIFAIGTNAAHHHPDIFKDGDQVRYADVIFFISV